MDMYTSIDLVIEKIERQIRKYKTKLEKRFREGSIRTEMMTPPAKPVEEDEAVVIKTKTFCGKTYGCSRSYYADEFIKP